MRKVIFYKQLLAFMLLLCSIAGVRAQATYICNEKFSSRIPSGWSIAPTYAVTSPSWRIDTGVVTSAKYAMHANIPINAGDTAELVTPFFDCSNYNFVTLKFNHICKVLPSDICEIQYQEQGLGTNYKWKNIPKDAYQGSCPLYKNDLNFSHNSYSAWSPNDTFAQANSNWYQQETFDITNYASLSKVRFRFIIRKGSYLGSFIASGWFVDDFQLLGSKFAIKPPVVEFLNAPTDTVFSNGPFVIEAKVATRTLAGIHNPYLTYTATLNKVSKKDSIKMTAVKGDSIWTATIPQHLYGTEIFYSIFGKDSAVNTARATGSCFLKRAKAGKPTYYTYYYPQDTTAATEHNQTIVYSFTQNTSLSRCLYPNADINPKNTSLTISRLAWYIRLNEPQVVVNRKIKVHLLATNDNTMTASYMDPVANKATLVFDGTTTSGLGWNEIAFHTPFLLPAGKNLYVFVEGYGGTNVTTGTYWACHRIGTGTQTTYSLNNGSSWTSNVFKPLIRFGIGSIVQCDSNSVALASIDNPKESTIAGKQSVKITLQNKGDYNLTSAKVNWMVNGVLQTPLQYTGNLPCDFYDTLTLGTYTQKLSGYDTITVWVNTPNNVYDSVTSDDTLEVISYGCNSYLKGDYTVGAGGKYDFPSLKDAFFVMNSCGLSGDVTFKLASGIYTEALDFRDVANTYNVHITSIAGNADSVIFRPTSKTVVELGKTQKMKFSYLTFDAKKARSYCVNIDAGCDDVEFYHCTLHGFDTSTTSNSYSTIYKASGGTVNNIRFIGNQILGGSNATYFYGASSTVHNTNILFDSNYIAGAYYYHGYFYYTDITFTNNVNEEVKAGYTYFYGPSFYYSDSSRIEGNRIRTHNYATYHYGLRFNYIDSTSYICNNEIVIHNDKTNSYGIYFYYPRGTVLANNTVLVYGKATTQYGIYTYLYTGYFGSIRNNISIVNGSNTTYPLYSSSTTGIQNFDIDYNCWWSAKYVSYLNGAAANLNTHLSKAPTATHDIYFRPDFTDSSRSLKPRSFTGLNCPSVYGAQYDINGYSRSLLTSMGCYTNVLNRNNAALVELLNVNPTSYITDTICPAVVLVNSGTDSLTEATITMEVNNVVIGKDIPWKGNLGLNQMDTLSLSCFVPKTGNNTITAYLTGIGAAKDSIPADDTVNLSTFTCNSQYAGTYYVGGNNADFADLNEAAIAIVSCGVSGPVVLKIRSGKYGATNINGIVSGASKTNSITVMPDSNARVVIDGGASIALSLSGTAYWNFEGLTIGNTTDGMIGVDLSPDVKYISFHNCNIYANKTTTNSTHRAVSLVNASGAAVYPEEVSFIHNNISGGYYNMYLYYMAGGTANMQNTVNITIDSNTLTDAYYYGIYSYYYAHYRSLAHNTVISRSNSSTYYGMYMNYYHNFDYAVEGNRVHVNCSGTGYGIYFYYYKNYSNYGGKPGTLCNNEVIVRGAGTTYGIYVNMPYQTWEVSHNSVYTESSSGTAYAAYFYNSGTNYTIDAFNNMFVAKGTTPYPIHVSSATYAISPYMTSDYNNYYSIGNSNIGYAGAAKTTLASWQSATGMDKNSTNIHPSFIDSTKSLELKDYTDFVCPVSKNVTSDISGVIRGQKTTMGCYTNRPPQNNAALVELLNVNSTSYITDTVCPAVVLMNSGADPLTEATITMEVNHVVIGKDIPWKGNLNMGQMDTLSLSCFVPKTGNNTITAYLTGIGSAKDTIPYDDTVNLSTFTCNSQYAGTYYIGGSNADFADLNEAAIAIASCGVSGPVVLKMRSGKYAATEIDGIVPGASKTNSITVMPDNNASVVIDGGADTALSVKNTAYWNFEGITIGNTTNGMIGVNLYPNVKYISFHNCNIYANKTATASTYKAVNLANASGATVYPEEVSFIHNNISGGYYNMYLYYLSGTTANMQNTVNITIDSNTLTDAYYYGIYSYYQAHYRSLAHNTVTSRSSSSTYYGIYLQYYHNFDQAIEGNRVYVNCSGSGYGIRFYYYKNYATYGGKTNTFCNNEVIVRGAGAKYGIYFYMPYQTWEVSHNSVYTESSSGIAYAAYLYNSDSSYKINAINNMFVAKGTTPYPIYISSASYATSSYLTLDYNNYYTIGNSNVGYAGAAKTTLASWQSATGMDKNSTNMRPSFIDSTKNLELKDYSKFLCPASKNVTADINGDARSATTMMGAYSTLFKKEIDLKAVAFADPKPITDMACYTNSTPVRLVLTNVGNTDADFKASAMKVSLNISGATNLRFDTTFTSGSMKAGQTDTISLMVLPTMANGTYNFFASLSDTADKNAVNDTLSMSYKIYRIELPYDINLSSTPNELVSNTDGKAGWKIKASVSKPNLAPVYGSGCMVFDGAANSGVTAKAVFNAINIKDCLRPTLSFWYAHNAACTGNDALSVLVSTDGGATTTEILKVSVKDSITAWKQYNIDLTKFNQASCLSIAFYAKGNGGSEQAIDRIRIKADKDAALELLPINIAARTACDNTPMEIKAVVRNLSQQELELNNDTITLNVSGAVNQSNNYVFNKKMSGLESDTILLGQITPSANGYYYIEAYMRSLDDNTANDTVRDSSIYVMQDIALVALEGSIAQVLKNAGDTVTLNALMVNTGNTVIRSSKIQMKINGKDVAKLTVNNIIGIGDTVKQVLSYVVPFATKANPSCTLEVIARIDCDADSTNNALRYVCKVNVPDSADIQVRDIIVAAKAVGKTQLKPSVRLANIGNVDADSIILHVEVLDSADQVFAHFRENIGRIAANDSMTYAFDSAYTVPNYTGSYLLVAYVEKQQTDFNQDNDTLGTAVTCTLDDTRIRENESLNWSMGQNIPNPAANITRIPFHLPQDAEVIFSVMSANGQLIYREQISAHSGNNTLEFDVNKLASGIYYYSMECKGQRIVKKMNVTK